MIDFNTILHHFIVATISCIGQLSVSISTKMQYYQTISKGSLYKNTIMLILWFTTLNRKKGMSLTVSYTLFLKQKYTVHG